MKYICKECGAEFESEFDTDWPICDSCREEQDRVEEEENEG